MNGFSIEAENLTKKFGSFTAVDNVSFSIKKGEIFGFLGPNGAGKTTTIRMLCGISDPTSGKGRVAGFDLATETEQIKMVIGYMSQKFSLYDDLTVSENIDFYAGIYQTPVETREKRKRELIEKAGLNGLEKTVTSNLAGSVKQHLALSCALIHNPKIVFLDEPTAGVDPISRREFWGIIRELSKEGITSLVTTHYMDEAEFCDRIALISSSRIIACDTPKNLKKQTKTDSLENAFIALVENVKKNTSDI
ncbi:MAG: ABC transporter ATP-binding protein [Candidatus Saganbacteria bacterium]|nr:ABC transporter ATP-binding protein [Candidatus Saganbacteria bacterium]